MAEAAQSHVQIDELQERASAFLAEATGAEAGLITSGAEAGLLLGTAACIAGLDPRKMDDLPFVHDGRNEVVVQRGHRNAYDHALRAAGAVFVEVGYLGSPGAGCHYAWQIEAAITEQDGRHRLPGHGHAGHGARCRRSRRWRIGTGCR